MYATPPATERERAVAALGAGRPHATLYRWRPKSSHGWTVRTRRAPIIENSELSMSAYSQGAWKRELGLTLFAGQHLPSHLFGGNSLELRHNASGVRVSFCALEALRAWAALQHPPVPHRATHAPPAEWDYTFTTNYPGATAVAALGQGMPAQPDGASFYSRPAVDLARGQAQLRRPLCKCRGTNGRAPLVSVGPAARDAASAIAPQAAEFEEAEAAVEQSAAVPPPWLPTQQAVELDSLLRGVTVPLFDDEIDLWRDDQDPHSLCSLRARVLCSERFWAVLLRFFVRVNGVMARIVDTKLVCRGSTVLRERSWREGSWDELVGMGGMAHVDLGGCADVVAAQRLPLIAPPTTELLTLPLTLTPLSLAPLILPLIALPPITLPTSLPARSLVHTPAAEGGAAEGGAAEGRAAEGGGGGYHGGVVEARAIVRAACCRTSRGGHHCLAGGELAGGD